MLEWINANAAGISALAAVATASIAAWALVRTSADSRDRSRPYVVVEYRKAPQVDQYLELVVRNAGQSPARKLQVTFEPMPDGHERDQNLRAYLIRRYAEEIPALMPGQEFTNVARMAKGEESTSDFPHQFTATVAYRGRFKSWKDTFDLNAHLWFDQTYVTSSKSPEGRLEQIAKAIRGLSSS